MAEPEICVEFEMDYKRLQQLRDYRLGPKVILDIGASNGVWSASCAQVFPEAEYFLVEPQVYPRFYPFPPSTQHHWIHKAVGRREDQVELKMPDGESPRYQAHIMGSPRENPARRLSVRQTTVDQLLKEGEIAPPDLVKIDVQGYELEVLEGATRLWETTKIFIVECSLYRHWYSSPVLDEVIVYFAQRGFHVCELSTEYRVSPSNLLSQIDVIFAPRTCHMERLMVPEGHPLWDELNPKNLG